jgi:hypothetical protein
MQSPTRPTSSSAWSSDRWVRGYFGPFTHRRPGHRSKPAGARRAPNLATRSMPLAWSASLLSDCAPGSTSGKRRPSRGARSFVVSDSSTASLMNATSPRSSIGCTTARRRERRSCRANMRAAWAHFPANDSPSAASLRWRRLPSHRNLVAAVLHAAGKCLH